MRRRPRHGEDRKDYVFDGPNGKSSLKTSSRPPPTHRLSFMRPGWIHRCQASRLGRRLEIVILGKRDTTFVLVSRAPVAMLDAYKAQKGWNLPWFSSFGSDFNYDFHVTLDPKVAPAEYNYRSKAEMESAMGHPVKFEGEEHGLSVFFRLDDDVFHTYSAYARALESLKDAYRLLDTTPYGRQQDFEDSPAGWPQKPTYP